MLGCKGAGRRNSVIASRGKVAAGLPCKCPSCHPSRVCSPAGHDNRGRGEQGDKEGGGLNCIHHVCLLRETGTEVARPFAWLKRRAHHPLFAQSATAMVSFGTLVALWLVCNAQLYRRYWPGVQMRFTQ